MKPTPIHTVFLSLLFALPALAATDPDWPVILGPAQGTIPPSPAAPEDRPNGVTWYGDLHAALDKAKAENRPVFVTLRCLPCKQCSAFDKDVLEGGPDLAPLLRQFVTVRLIDAKSIDLRLLPAETWQDLDLSWWGYFLSPEGKVYGVFGGRDEVSDATRISKPALINTLKRVLAHHYDPRRSAWDIDGPLPDLQKPQMPLTDLPGYASWSKGHKQDPRTEAAGCIHCHQVAEILRQPAILAKTFDRDRDLQIWPLPENVGIKLDRDDGLRISGIVPNSPAEKAGLKEGDSLAAAGAPGALRKLFGQADFRGILHRLPRETKSFTLYVVRDGKPVAADLTLADGWRKTVLDWRKSISQGNIGAGPGFFPLKASDAERTKLGIASGSMLVHVFAPQGSAKAAGLLQNDMMIAIDGQKPDVAERGLMVWFRMHHEHGDPVTVTVLRAGKPVEIQYQAGE